MLMSLAAFGSALWIWFALTTRISLEDAYITFRYARNIAQGNGFVYNLGERVLGTTSPLQTLLLAGLGLTFGPERIPLVASLLMPIFGIGAGILAFLAVRRYGGTCVGTTIGLLLFYLHPLVMRTSVGGMETPLVLFLMALSLYFVADRRAVPATIAIAFLALCRIDGLIWGGLVIAATLLSNYRRPLRQAVSFGAVVVPWVLFSWLYFGSPMPNSMIAKGVIRPGREGLLMDPVHFSRLSRFYLSGTTLGMDRWVILISVTLLVLGVIAVFRARRLELSLLPVFPAVYVVLMYIGRAPMFQWYLAPMLLCCLFLMGLGVGQAVVWTGVRERRGRIKAVALACLAAAALPRVADEVRTLPRRVRHTKLFQENEFGLRRAVGLWLREHTPRDTSVAMEAIGYQGYYSERRVIDMAGLVTPRVIEYNAGTGSNGLVFKHITTELRPDYIVLRSFEVADNHHFKGGKLFETPEDQELFFRWYREARTFTAPHAELAPLLTRLTLYERLPNSRSDGAGSSGESRPTVKIPSATPHADAARASLPPVPEG
jgi:hypothetical protein